MVDFGILTVPINTLFFTLLFTNIFTFLLNAARILYTEYNKRISLCRMVCTDSDY